MPGVGWAIGMSSYDFVTYTYQCPSCRTEITYEEQCYVAKEQKRTNSRILRNPFSGIDNMFATQTKPKYARRPLYLILLLSRRFLATLMGPSVMVLIQARLLPQP